MHRLPDYFSPLAEYRWSRITAGPFCSWGLFSAFQVAFGICCMFFLCRALLPAAGLSVRPSSSRWSRFFTLNLRAVWHAAFPVGRFDPGAASSALTAASWAIWSHRSKTACPEWFSSRYFLRGSSSAIPATWSDSNKMWSRSSAAQSRPASARAAPGSRKSSAKSPIRGAESNLVSRMSQMHKWISSAHQARSKHVPHSHHQPKEKLQAGLSWRSWDALNSATDRWGDLYLNAFFCLASLLHFLLLFVLEVLDFSLQVLDLFLELFILLGNFLLIGFFGLDLSLVALFW